MGATEVIGSDIIVGNGGGGGPTLPTLTAISTLADGLGLHMYALDGSTLRGLSDISVGADFRIESLPATGTLTVNGNPVTVGVTLITDVDSFEWTTPADVQGDQTMMTVVAWDGVNASSPPVPVVLSVSARSMAFTFRTGGGTVPRTIAFVTATGFANTHWTFVGGTEDTTVVASNPNTVLSNPNTDYIITQYGDPTGPTVWSINKNIKNITLLQTSLTSITISGTTALGAVNLTGMSNLTSFTSTNSGLTSLTLTGCSALTTLAVSSNAALTTTNIADSPLLSSVNIGGCGLTTTAVNAVLGILAAGSINGGTCLLGGGTNGAPSGAGIVARTVLLSAPRGPWTVSTN